MTPQKTKSVNETENDSSSSDSGIATGPTDPETIGGTRSGPAGANLFVYHLPKTPFFNRVWTSVENLTP